MPGLTRVQADRRYLKQLSAARQHMVIATRSKTGNARSATTSANALSDGTTTEHNTRFRHFATADAHSIRLVYGNSALGDSGPNPITVKAAFEYAGGAIVPAYFGGAREVTIQPGGIAISDPIAAEVANSGLFRTRQRVTVTTAGMKWPLGPRIDTSIGDGGAPTDSVDTGTLTANNNTFAFGPTAILGVPTTMRPVVFLLGDSIVQGIGDTGGEPVTDAGWPARALNNGFGYINGGRSGETAAQFVPGNARRVSRLPLARYCTHALVEHGVNDIKGDVDVATLQANLTSIWNGLAAMGLTVYQSTITPVTTSTDAFATTANQTVQAAGRETVRVTVNNWIRTKPAPLSGVVDVADAAETVRNSGIWKAGYTGDGTHPNGTGAAALAAAWDTTALHLP